MNVCLGSLSDSEVDSFVCVCTVMCVCACTCVSVHPKIHNKCGGIATLETIQHGKSS